MRGISGGADPVQLGSGLIRVAWKQKVRQCHDCQRQGEQQQQRSVGTGDIEGAAEDDWPDSSGGSVERPRKTVKSGERAQTEITGSRYGVVAASPPAPMPISAAAMLPVKNVSARQQQDAQGGDSVDRERDVRTEEAVEEPSHENSSQQTGSAEDGCA